MRTTVTNRLLGILLASAVCVAAPGGTAAQTPQQAASQKQLPSELSDSAFWNIISTFSESEQNFSTYMVSNERFYPVLVSTLLSLNAKGGAYVGVAPEQNFHYIAAIRPRVAFILDIRRQAVIQHLMFKAIFELSPDRADFISLLFTKPRPAGVAANLSAFQTWTAFWNVATDTTKFTTNLNRILDHLTKKHKFPLTTYDSSLVHYTFSAFYVSGPNMTSNGGSGAETSPTTFGNITSAVDNAGVERSFLANEDGYQAVRQLHLKNLIIPIVGDFAGTKALRAIGTFLTEHNLQLTAFYASNVETYLGRDGRSTSFYDNLATFPLNQNSILIRGISPGSLCNLYAFIGSKYTRCG